MFDFFQLLCGSPLCFYAYVLSRYHVHFLNLPVVLPWAVCGLRIHHPHPGARRVDFCRAFGSVKLSCPTATNRQMFRTRGCCDGTDKDLNVYDTFCTIRTTLCPLSYRADGIGRQIVSDVAMRLLSSRTRFQSAGRKNNHVARPDARRTWAPQIQHGTFVIVRQIRHSKQYSGTRARQPPRARGAGLQ